MAQFFTKYIDENTVLPVRELTSSVFLIAIKDGKILAIQNERGWDIPGGHVEEGESVLEGLVREVQEEGGATFQNEKLLALIESDDEGKYKDKVMLVYMADNFELGEFVPSEDAFGREEVEIEEFIKRYSQSHSGLDLIDMVHRAKELLNK
ncbi:MAG: NUDIX domain-containing protein [Patescibacteria group bacterium]